MEHLQDEQQRNGVLGGVAAVLNAGGSAAVYAYDITSGAFGRLISVAKKAGVIRGKASGLFTNLGVETGRSGKIARIEEKIGTYQKKIRRLYYEIGKAGATHTGDESALETEPVKKLIGAVRENEKEIERLKNRIVEIREQKKTAVLKRKESAAIAKKREEAPGIRVAKTLKAAIARAVRHGEFETRSETEVFDKVANDLLDSEMEVKILAAAELGKIGSAAAVPVLIEASKFDDTDLVSEIINSLVSIGDVQAVPLLREKVSDPSYRIRIGCLRGIYKLADDRDSVPVLKEALQDGHPEVRRTAATFIGWKDSAGASPGLIQCLRDEDARVRKAAVAALTNLKDESSVLPLIKVLADKELDIREKALEAVKIISDDDSISFDVHASGPELKEAVSDVRGWWEKERLGRVDVTGIDAEADDADVIAAEIAAAEEQAAKEEAETEETKAEAVEETISEETEAEETVDEEKAEPEETVDEEVAEAEETVDEEKAEAEETVDEEVAEAEETVDEEVAEAEETVDEEVAEAEETVDEEKAEAEEDAGTEETADEGKEGDDETGGEPVSPEEPQYKEEHLKRMVKTELITICTERKIEADETMLKSEIIDLIIGEKE